MTGVSLLALFLCVTLGLCLSTASRKVAVIGVILLVSVAVGVFLTLHTVLPMRTVIIGAGLSIAVMGLLAWFPRLLSPPLLFLFAIIAGLWTGLAAEFPDRLAQALSGALVVIPGMMAVNQKLGISVKVIASWMVAIALLAVALNTLSMPSYQLDHMG